MDYAPVINRPLKVAPLHHSIADTASHFSDLINASLWVATSRNNAMIPNTHIDTARPDDLGWLIGL